MTLEEENKRLRKLVAFAHTEGHMYTDDGELQDSSMMPWIDFKRDTVEEIEEKLHKRAMIKMGKAKPETEQLGRTFKKIRDAASVKTKEVSDNTTMMNDGGMPQHIGKSEMLIWEQKKKIKEFEVEIGMLRNLARIRQSTEAQLIELTENAKREAAEGG